MEIQQLEKILGRKQHEDLISLTTDARILVTGGGGSIGQRLKERCPNAVLTDLDTFDITSDLDHKRINKDYKYIINLAGLKHAPEGEENVMEAITVNTLGVDKLIQSFPNAHIVHASTCKACNPETVYGATKLISEKLILNSGNTVARFYNVVETSGNVFEIWQNEPREVYDCFRYFISLDEAVGLLIYCTLKKGRFSVNPGHIRSMIDIFKALGYEGHIRERRRGDRQEEMLISYCETFKNHGSIIEVTSYHDKHRQNKTSQTQTTNGQTVPRPVV